MLCIYNVPKLHLSTLPQQVKKKSELGFNDFFWCCFNDKGKMEGKECVNNAALPGNYLPQGKLWSEWMLLSCGAGEDF